MYTRCWSTQYLPMSLSEPTTSHARRGGRQGRAARRRQPHPPVVAPPRRNIPTYELLPEAAVTKLEQQADWLLSRIGIDVRGDEEALELFRSAGAHVDGERVRLEPGHARALCASAPSQFTMHGRDPGYSITIGGDHLVMLPAYGPPFVTDLDRGRRYATMEDFRNFVKLTFASPWLHHSGGTICEPVDLPVSTRHLDMTYAHLRYSLKPFMGAVTAPARAQDSLDMARIVFGREFMENHCVIQGNINVNSPLVFDATMTGALKAYARANQGCVISPFIVGGAMGPITQPALLAQAHAETMAGIALSQLVRRGAPVVYGNFLTTMNLASGAPTFGTPDALLSTYAIAQLCRRLGLPLRCGGHLTASKVADGQAMQESADSMMAAILAGTNYVIHAAGWLESGLSIGYEKFVMDLDHCATIHRLLAGVQVDAETLASEAFIEAGPGGVYLSTKHTLANVERVNYSAALCDTESFERWTENGSLDMQQRANALWKSMLASYEAPIIDASTDAALLAFVEQRKQELPERWY